MHFLCMLFHLDNQCRKQRLPTFSLSWSRKTGSCCETREDVNILLGAQFSPSANQVTSSQFSSSSILFEAPNPTRRESSLEQHDRPPLSGAIMAQSEAQLNFLHAVIPWAEESTKGLLSFYCPKLSTPFTSADTCL